MNLLHVNFSQNFRTEKLRGDNYTLESGDEFVDKKILAAQMAMEAKCAAGQCRSMPSKQLVKIKVMSHKNLCYN